MIRVSKTGIILMFISIVLSVIPQMYEFETGLTYRLFNTIVVFTAIHGMTLIILKAVFPGIYIYLISFLENNLKITENNNGKIRAMTIYEKSKVALWLLSLYLIIITSVILAV